MPTFCNADRFLATNIANFRYAKGDVATALTSPGAESNAPTNSRSTTILAPQSPRARSSNFNGNGPLSARANVANNGLVGKNDAKSSDLVTAIKAFCGIFLGTAGAQKNITINQRLEMIVPIHGDVLHFCSSRKVGIEDGKFKEAVVDAFNGLRASERTNFIGRCKKFLASISGASTLNRNFEGLSTIQFSRRVLEVCNDQLAEDRSASVAVKIDLESDRKIFSGVVQASADSYFLPDSYSDEDMARLLVGKA